MEFVLRTLLLALLSAGTAYFLTPFIVAQGLLTPLVLMASPLLESRRILDYLNLKLGVGDYSEGYAEGLPRYSVIGLSIFVAGILAYLFWLMLAPTAFWATLSSAISSVSATWTVGSIAFLWGAFYPRTDASWREFHYIDWTLELLIGYFQIPIRIVRDVFNLTFLHAVPSALLAILNVPTRLLGDWLGLKFVKSIPWALGVFFRASRYPVLMALKFAELVVLLPFLLITLFTSIPQFIAKFSPDSFGVYGVLRGITQAALSWVKYQLWHKAYVEKGIRELTALHKEQYPEQPIHLELLWPIKYSEHLYLFKLLHSTWKKAKDEDGKSLISSVLENSHWIGFCLEMLKARGVLTKSGDMDAQLSNAAPEVLISSWSIFPALEHIARLSPSPIPMSTKLDMIAWILKSGPNYMTFLSLYMIEQKYDKEKFNRTWNWDIDVLEKFANSKEFVSWHEQSLSDDGNWKDGSLENLILLFQTHIEPNAQTRGSDGFNVGGDSKSEEEPHPTDAATVDAPLLRQYDRTRSLSPVGIPMKQPAASSLDEKINASSPENNLKRSNSFTN